MDTTILPTLSVINGRAPNLPDGIPVAWSIPWEDLSFELWAMGLPHYGADIARALRSAASGCPSFPWTPSMRTDGRVVFRPAP